MFGLTQVLPTRQFSKDRGIDETADLYLEGSDQHRGWFQSSLITSHAINNKSPIKMFLLMALLSMLKVKKCRSQLVI